MHVQQPLGEWLKRGSPTGACRSGTRRISDGVRARKPARVAECVDAEEVAAHREQRICSHRERHDEHVLDHVESRIGSAARARPRDRAA
jgi:hypothetical protein